MTFKNSRSYAWLACLAAVLFVSSQASAAIMYGDFSDIPPGAVMYLDVTESSSTDPVPPPKYGAPTITGNDLDFNPTGFGASAADGNPSADITDGQLNFTFMTLPGAGLSNLAISESGDFTLFGAGGTASTSIAAGIYAEVEISEINQTALANPISITATTQFTTDLVSSPGLNQPWGQVLFVDFGPALINAGFDPAEDLVTKGDVAINDTLVAISEIDPATIAFIAKKDFKITPGGELDPEGEIPEPTALALTLLAVAGLGYRRK